MYKDKSMRKMRMEEVKARYNDDSLIGCYKLYDDNTESVIDSLPAWDEIMTHHDRGGEFGEEIKIDKYGMALIEKSGEEGLTLQEIKAIYELLSDENAYPIEIFARQHESSAMGFITPAAANKLDFEFSELENHIAEILDDMEKESPNHKYEYEGVTIYMARNINKLSEMSLSELPAGWIRTDDMQYCRKIDDKIYELIEADEVDDMFVIAEPQIIDINEWLDKGPLGIKPSKELVSIVKTYYKSMEDFYNVSGDQDTTYQYLAEMIYECTTHISGMYHRLLTEDEADMIMLSYITTGELSDYIYAGIY